MESQIKELFIKNSPKLRCCQGDILKDMTIALPTDIDIKSGEYDLSMINLNYGIVISQECDLEHDYNNRENPLAPNQDKFLPNILILPAYLPDTFRKGTHRGEGISSVIWPSADYKVILQNNNARFYYLKGDTAFQIPDLVIDFKHIFSVNRTILYKHLPTTYLATIAELFRESLSHRFSHYISRIGLPEINNL